MLLQYLWIVIARYVNGQLESHEVCKYNSLHELAFRSLHQRVRKKNKEIDDQVMILPNCSLSHSFLSV